MTDFVALRLRRNRGWPVPESSYGLTPMFGEAGWCHSCAIPNTTQRGSIVLKGVSAGTRGAWSPNWRYDVICADPDLADRLRDLSASIEWLPVTTPSGAEGPLQQVVIPTLGPNWFDPGELSEAATRKHGLDGATCPECGVWKWQPLAPGSLPTYRIPAGIGEAPFAASPEWFGVRLKAYRQIIARADIGRVLVSASPRDFELVEV